MRVEVYQNWLSEEECSQLAEWALGNKDQFVDGYWHDFDGRHMIRVKNRITNRVSTNIEYPQLVYDIQSRIARQLETSGFQVTPGHGKDGIVTSITYDTGAVHRHIDGHSVPGTYGLRFNVLVSQPNRGGTIHVGDQQFNLNRGDAMAYLVSKHPHSVDVCRGGKRILFMFGWCVPPNFWEPE